MAKNKEWTFLDSDPPEDFGWSGWRSYGVPESILNFDFKMRKNETAVELRHGDAFELDVSEYTGTAVVVCVSRDWYYCDKVED